MSVVITDLGTANNSGGNVSITTSVDIPAGALICVFGAGTGAAVVDDGTNVFTLAQSISAGVNGGLWYKYNIMFIPAGGFIEYGANAGTPDLTMSAFFATGIVSDSDPLDASGETNYGALPQSSPTVSITTVTADCLLVGGVAFDQTNATTYTQASGFATPFTKGGRTSSTLMFVAGGNKVVSTTGSQTFAPTLGTAGNGGIILAAFKIAPVTGGGAGNFLSFF